MTIVKQKDHMSEAKSFEISKHVVLEAYRRVKANKGSAGIDGISIKEFEIKLEDNLYKIWNRMSSGTYFPPPVRMVEIPKADGKMRQLGIPTVGDRIAQMVVKMHLEPEMDKQFHPNSYGYRPNKSAKDAVRTARKKCWEYNWVVDLDIKGFFDNMDHDLVMKALKRHTNCKWILMYVERWLKAPAMLEDGTIIQRTKGTPQGGVISPLLANLFMHYAFDEWMRINHPANPFERYADDVVIHCETEKEAEEVLEKVKSRLKECMLEVHPEKTKIVYCKDDNRDDDYPNTKFDFLGHTFKMRQAKGKREKLFMGFLPAVSEKAAKKIREKLVELKIHSATEKSLSEIAEECNPIIRGWINYYGEFYKSALDKVLQCINERLAKWAKKKYKRFHASKEQAAKWISEVQLREPKLFAHW